MDYSKIISNSKYLLSPKNGAYLIYFSKKVFFGPFAGKEEVEKIMSLSEYGNLLEVHIFDDNKEFRAISTDDKRHKEGIICYIADFKYDDAGSSEENSVYIEKTEINMHSKSDSFYGNKLWVLNHLKYENGMAYVDDFRLRIGGER